MRAATHPSLATIQGFFLVCSLAGLGAAGWSPKLLSPGTAPLAGPLPDVSNTVAPSGGALHGQRVPPGPAYRRRAPTSSQVRGRPTRSPTPCRAPRPPSSPRWPRHCALGPPHATHSPASSNNRGECELGRGQVPSLDTRRPALLLNETPVSPCHTASVSLSHSYPCFLVLSTNPGPESNLMLEVGITAFATFLEIIYRCCGII